ncbi:MAG TPA: pseudouridine-5'-phosphate glycosidase, partial [Firmicutes bacterium]|nr:pseudouridine-5'-phosphate glycosidase [Bacillota bacterium]
MTDNFLLVSEEVKEAQARGGAVVALESTIIAHGMPYPANVETALRVEKIVRENGAVPATIAILGGRVVVGVDNSQIEYLGKKGTQIPKVSRRDVPVILARRQDGAATVAATMLAAGLAGIQVFAT